MLQIENADLDLVATINKTPEGNKGILKLRGKVYQIVPETDACRGCCFHTEAGCSENKASDSADCDGYKIIFKEYSGCPEKEYQGDIDYSKQDTKHDVVNKPKHYMLIPEKGIEVRDLMQVLADRLENNEYSAMFISDYIQMQQYLLRFDQKNGKEDLEKAKWYLEKLIEYGS